MEHQEAKHLLSLYIDGQLEKNGRRELEAHLKSCENCRTELESLRSAVAALSRLPVEKMPEEAAARLRRRLGLAEDEKQPLARRLIFSPLLPLAAIALVLAISVTVISLSGPVQMRTLSQTEMNGSQGPAIVADIPESPADKSANEYSPVIPESDAAPEKGQQERSTPGVGQRFSTPAEERRLIFSDKNYTSDELLSLFAIEKTEDGDFERLKQRFIRDAGAEGEELSIVFDVLREKYPAARLIYIERAKFQDKPAWIIVVETGGIKRIIVFS